MLAMFALFAVALPHCGSEPPPPPKPVAAVARAAPATLTLEPDVAKKQLASFTSGWRAVGKPTPTTVDALGSQTFTAATGTCYRAVIDVPGGWSPAVGQGLQGLATLPGGRPASAPAQAYPGNATVDLGCAATDGQARLALASLGGGSLGQGAATVHVFSRYAGDFDWSGANLDDWLVAGLAGYSPVGTPIPGRLEAPLHTPLQLESGACYKLAMRLGEDAHLSGEAVGNGVLFVLGPPAPVAAYPLVFHGPGGLADVGCQAAGGAGTTWMGPAYGSSLGTGSFVVRIWRKKATADELATAAADAASASSGGGGGGGSGMCDRQYDRCKERCQDYSTRCWFRCQDCQGDGCTSWTSDCSSGCTHDEWDCDEECDKDRSACEG